MSDVKIHLKERNGLYRVTGIVNENGTYRFQVETRSNAFLIYPYEVKCFKGDEKYHRENHRSNELFLDMLSVYAMLGPEQLSERIFEYAERLSAGAEKIMNDHGLALPEQMGQQFVLDTAEAIADQLTAKHGVQPTPKPSNVDWLDWGDESLPF